MLFTDILVDDELRVEATSFDKYDGGVENVPTPDQFIHDSLE